MLQLSSSRAHSAERDAQAKNELWLVSATIPKEFDKVGELESRDILHGVECFVDSKEEGWR